MTEERNKEKTVNGKFTNCMGGLGRMKIDKAGS